jgi:hypothetical protein
MKRNKLLISLLVTTAVFLPVRQSLAQDVSVTMSLDAPTISVGGATTLHIYAQVVSGLRTNTDRIVSWYVDVLNTNGAAVSANYGAMQKPTSDKDPQTSSNGVPQASNRRGIYDTFLNLPGAGTTNAVELMSIPVNGVAIGQTRFQVQAGSGVPLLSSDFQVAPKGGGPAYVGGDYASAFVDLTVSDFVPCLLQLQATRLAGGGGSNVTLQLNFSPCPGRNHTVEFRALLNDVTGWQPLTGAPHNSGSVTVTNTATQRFFRVRAN